MAKKKTIGVNFLIQVNKGTDASPSFVTVGGQRDGKLSHSVDLIDITAKDSEGYLEKEYGYHSWSLDCSGVLIEDDEAFVLLEDCLFENKKVQIQMLTESGKKYVGMALIEDFPIDAGYKSEATYSMKFTGTGKLARVAATVTP